MTRENEPEQIRNSARPPEHGCGYVRIGDQVGQRPRRLRLGPTPVPGDRHRLQQPVHNGASAGADDRSPSACIRGGNVGKQRRDPELESRAHLVVGRRQHRRQRMPKHRGGHAGLLGVVENLPQRVAGFLDRVLDATVQRIGGPVIGSTVVIVGGEEGVGGDKSGD